MAIICSLTINYQMDHFSSWIITESDNVGLSYTAFAVLAVLALILALIITYAFRPYIQPVGPMTFR